MDTVVNYESIFERYRGIMRTCELTKEGISDQMALKEIKDMGVSVLARLRKQAIETGINYQTCLQLFAQEEFLRRKSFFVKNICNILKSMVLFTCTLNMV